MLLLMKFKKELLLAFVLCISVLGSEAQVRPVNDYGAIGLGQLLRKLQTTGSVMMVGAHPDDEDSALLAYLARGENARTAYLSLTRGDGGQKPGHFRSTIDELVHGSARNEQHLPGLVHTSVPATSRRSKIVSPRRGGSFHNLRGLTGRGIFPRRPIFS